MAKFQNDKFDSNENDDIICYFCSKLLLVYILIALRLGGTF